MVPGSSPGRGAVNIFYRTDREASIFAIFFDAKSSSPTPMASRTPNSAL